MTSGNTVEICQTNPYAYDEQQPGQSLRGYAPSANDSTRQERHPLAGIAARIDVQASILSYLDVFVVLGVVALCVSPLALFLPKMPKGAAVGVH